jgi:hypothetical protein
MHVTTSLKGTYLPSGLLQSQTNGYGIECTTANNCTAGSGDYSAPNCVYDGTDTKPVDAAMLNYQIYDKNNTPKKFFADNNTC